MKFLSLQREAELYRTLYRAMLHSILRTPGQKQTLAQRSEISVQYLSQLLSSNRDEKRSQPPSTAIAARIARDLAVDVSQQQQVFAYMTYGKEQRLRMIEDAISDLPIEPNEQRAVLEYIFSYHETQRESYSAFSQDIKYLNTNEMLHHLRTTNGNALYTSQSTQSDAEFRVAYQLGQTIFRTLNPTTYPIDFAEVCFILTTIALILDQVAVSLYYAKIGLIVLESVSPTITFDTQLRVDDLQFNLILAEASAYHHLGSKSNIAAALLRYQRANQHPVLVRDPARFVPMLCYAWMPSIVKQPRFAVAEVAYLADRVIRVYDTTEATEATYTDVLLTNRALAGAYLRVRSLRKAEKLLYSYAASIDTAPTVNIIHQAMYHRTRAQLHWLQADKDAWKESVSQAVALAQAGGLVNQLRRMQQEFGEAVTPLLSQTV